MSGRALSCGILNLLTLTISARSQSSAQVRDQALEAIKRFDGRLVLDESRPDRPIIRLDLNGPRVTNTTAGHLRGLLQLQTLFLCETKITDAGMESLKGLRD